MTTCDKCHKAIAGRPYTMLTLGRRGGKHGKAVGQLCYHCHEAWIAAGLPVTTVGEWTPQPA